MLVNYLSMASIIRLVTPLLLHFLSMSTSLGLRAPQWMQWIKGCRPSVWNIFHRQHSMRSWLTRWPIRTLYHLYVGNEVWPVDTSCLSLRQTTALLAASHGQWCRLNTVGCCTLGLPWLPVDAPFASGSRQCHVLFCWWFMLVWTYNGVHLPLRSVNCR